MAESGSRRGAAGANAPLIRIFFCGDVMTGRGIDQALPDPCDPTLYEQYVSSAVDYIRLAELKNGPIHRPVAPSYIWGVALGELRRASPDVRLINLETSITRSDEFEPKGINYRMSPENAACLPAAEIDCCVLANNHVLDWGTDGLTETLATLRRLKIKSAGAGRNLSEATAPAVLPVAGKGRVLVFAFASVTSGVPAHWAAAADRPGVHLLHDFSETTVDRIAAQIAQARRPGDIVVASIHWGPNWGYEIPSSQRRFAHALIDRAQVSIVHGHSSHHPKAIERHENAFIFYGCGDFLNDYEGISGREEFRNDLSLMYFADVEAAGGKVTNLEMVPLQIRQFRLHHASGEDAEWLRGLLDRESAPFGVRVKMTEMHRLMAT